MKCSIKEHFSKHKNIFLAVFLITVFMYPQLQESLLAIGFLYSSEFHCVPLPIKEIKHHKYNNYCSKKQKMLLLKEHFYNINHHLIIFSVHTTHESLTLHAHLPIHLTTLIYVRHFSLQSRKRQVKVR